MDAPDGTPGQGAEVKARFCMFGDKANIDRNQFGCTRWNSLMMCGIWNLASVLLEIVLVLVEDMCTVYA